MRRPNIGWLVCAGLGSLLLFASGSAVAQDKLEWRGQVAQAQPPAGGRAQTTPSGQSDRIAAPDPSMQQGRTSGQVGTTRGEFGQAKTDILDPKQLLIQAPPEQLDALLKLIEEIDKLGGAGEPMVQTVPLQYAESSNLARVLTYVYTARNDARTVDANNQQSAVGKAGFVSLANPNAVVVVARRSEIDEICAFVKSLDVAAKSGSPSKLFQLKHAPADKVANLLNQFFTGGVAATGTTTGPQPAPTATTNTNTFPGLKPRVEVVADLRTNSIVVYAGPVDMQKAEELIEMLDRDTIAAKDDMRIFQLKNSAALDLAALLNQAINRRATAAASGSTAAQQQTTTTPTIPGQNANQASGAAVAAAGTVAALKSSVLRMVKKSGSGEWVESGILEDITITPDSRTNSLLVTAPKQTMSLIEEVIKQLDGMPNPHAVLKVFTLNNADASAMLTTLNSFFAGQSGTSGGGNNFGGGQNFTTGNTQGNSLPPVFRLVGDNPPLSLVPLNFGLDQRTNSILVYGSENDVFVVEALLRKLDSNNSREKSYIVYRLNNLPSVDAQAAIDNFIQSQANAATTAAVAGAATGNAALTLQQQIAQDVVVVAENRTNQLIIAASPRYLAQVLKLVETIDRRPPQVLIKVLLAQVNLQDNEDFGIELGGQSQSAFQRNVISNNALVPGVNFNTTSALPSASSASYGGTALQSLTNFALGRGNQALGFGGLVLSASSESVSVLLRALKRQNRIDVLSRPQIMTLDNRQAQMLVGQSVPLITTTNTGQLGNVNNSYEYRDVGVILIVQPQISPDGLIVMTVNPQVSSLDTTNSIPTAVNTTGQVVATAPIINITNVTTTVTAADGQTVVLGGLISRSRTRDIRKVPIIGDVPVLGWAFRTEFQEVRKQELLIILTPKIVYSDNEIAQINEEEGRRMDWCMPDIHAVHGDPYAMPLPAKDGNDRRIEPLGTLNSEQIKALIQANPQIQSLTPPAIQQPTPPATMQQPQSAPMTAPAPKAMQPQAEFQPPAQFQQQPQQPTQFQSSPVQFQPQLPTQPQQPPQAPVIEQAPQIAPPQANAPQAQFQPPVKFEQQTIPAAVQYASRQEPQAPATAGSGAMPASALMNARSQMMEQRPSMQTQMPIQPQLPTQSVQQIPQARTTPSVPQPAAPTSAQMQDPRYRRLMELLDKNRSPSGAPMQSIPSQPGEGGTADPVVPVNAQPVVAPSEPTRLPTFPKRASETGAFNKW